MSLPGRRNRAKFLHAAVSASDLLAQRSRNQGHGVLTGIQVSRRPVRVTANSVETHLAEGARTSGSEAS